MSTLSRESIGNFLEKNYGHEAASGFLKWSEDQKWMKMVQRFISDYKSFVAGGGDIKKLTKNDIYAYLEKAAGKKTADLFLKYSSKEALAKLTSQFGSAEELKAMEKNNIPKFSKIPMADLKAMANKNISKYAGEYVKKIRKD
ncbi:MAG: hypothetical protein IJ242_00655 [Clostridia bacterium]|nr:hypothetical protein [Clostridia bacterium]